jgi:hypothetical protein
MARVAPADGGCWAREDWRVPIGRVNVQTMWGTETVGLRRWGCAGGAPGARTLNPWIKSLIGLSSSRFAGGRCAGQFGGAYACEQACTRANCN